MSGNYPKTHDAASHGNIQLNGMHRQVAPNGSLRLHLWTLSVHRKFAFHSKRFARSERMSQPSRNGT